MAVWQCPKCGLEREGRCKPKKCTTCDEQVAFEKKEAKSEENKKK
ncbi:RCKP-type rubredoxin-like domain-containing protein [Dethiobacter alkaliphilus]|uniref:Rubredoxin n=1 Tax=Dethiobacter alkaliphilus AHT 1 TaxID=555088 RepID=C0GI57_DETAL|nr:hypothetical protein [Dethiobacter alkaliphilus]EEG76905.1 conserved hypothetical protein [Dethiobacter alkaliphilus AHT 1]MCW3488993.1 hypothetical protein [Dethiobacter alkaliphilus]